MSGDRKDGLGIKQVVRLEWMQKAVALLLAGCSPTETRSQLHEILASTTGSGAKADRGATSRSQVVNILMNTWVKPGAELLPFRDAALNLLRGNEEEALVIHWAMMSAAYPFWFHVAKQVGRLLALQDQVTQAQIFARLKERYGDRETVARYSRYCVRSFHAWGVLNDSAQKGCYVAGSRAATLDPEVGSLLVESLLHCHRQQRIPLGNLLGSPALFAFTLPVLSGSQIASVSDRLEIVRVGLDEELLTLSPTI